MYSKKVYVNKRSIFREEKFKQAYKEKEQLRMSITQEITLWNII